jgi:hypothetical protein
MLGPLYHIRERDLKTGELEPQEYAEELLADLLNRARVLEAAAEQLFDAHLHEPDNQDRLSAAENLLRLTVDTFVLDVQETRLRGRRARLFAYCRDDDSVSTGTIERDESLAEIGGALVTDGWDHLRVPDATIEEKPASLDHETVQRIGREAATEVLSRKRP